MSATGNTLHRSKKEINPYCFNMMQFKDSFQNRVICPIETCTMKLDEKKLKCAESNCCLLSSPSDMAPLYAVEIAKLWIQQNCKNGAVSLGQKMINVKEKNDQQFKDISMMTSGEEVIQCQQMKNIGVMTSRGKVAICQQIKDIGVMTSGQEIIKCQHIKDIAVMTSGEKVTQCQEIKDIGVMTSRVKITQCQEIKDIGVMTSREKVTHGQEIKNVGVMTSGQEVIQCHEIKDIGVMTSGEKVTQCAQKTFSDEPTSHKIMAVDGLVGYEAPPLLTQVPKCPKTDQILNSRDMMNISQKCSGSNKQCTTKEDVNCLIPGSCPLEGREKILKQAEINSTTSSGKNEIMKGSEVTNSSTCKCKDFSVSEPTVLKNTVDKHPYHENNASDKKYSNEITLFLNGNPPEKWCDNSHPVICNVVHRLPLEASDRSSYNRLLRSEGGLLPEKVDKGKQCAPELQQAINTQDTTRKPGSHGISLRKTASADQLHPGCEKRDQHQIPCCNVHQTKKDCDLRGVQVTNANKSNYYPHTDLSANINPEMHCNIDSGITKRDEKRKVLGSQGNSLEFPTADNHFTCNTVAQSIGPWFQETSQKIENNGYDTKIKIKPPVPANTGKKLKGGHLDNEFQGEDYVRGQRGIIGLTRKNSISLFKKRSQKLDEGISMNGMRITFTDITAKEENTRKFTKKRSMWSFFQNLLRTLDPSRKKDKQPMPNKSSTFLTVSFKKHNMRKLKREMIHRETYGFPEIQYKNSNSGHDRKTTLIENEQSCNYTPETNTSTEKMPGKLSESDLQANSDSKCKKHGLTCPAHQHVYRACTSSSAQPKSFNFDKMKHSVTDNKQLKFDQRTSTYKKQSSQPNHYTSSKANERVRGSPTSKENKYYGQRHTITTKQEAVTLLKDLKHGDMLNRDATVPVLFQDETLPLKTDESNKNIVVMVAEVHSSSVVVNQDIMEELRQQRRDIDGLKKILGKNENKTHNTSCFKNSRKHKPQHRDGISSEFGVSIVPDLNKNIMNFQTASDTQNVFNVTEQPLTEQVLNQKPKSISLHDYFTFNSIRFKNRGQVPVLTVKRTHSNFLNHHTDICHDNANGYTWRNNTRHGHRRAEKKHLHCVIRYCRNCKTSLWNKILSLFRLN